MWYSDFSGGDRSVTNYCAKHAILYRHRQGGEDGILPFEFIPIQSLLARGEAHPDIVQGTAAFHHQIADARLPQANSVFDDAATLDTTVDMRNPQPTLFERLACPLLHQRELLTAWLPGRHEALDLRKREGQEAEIL